MTRDENEWVDCEPPAEYRRDGKRVAKVWQTSRGWAWAAQFGGLYEASEASEASGTYFGEKGEAMAACEKWCRKRGV